MMHFNKVFMMKGLIPLAACSALTACVDDNYDLTDIDTTSRFTVNNLTVPVNLSEIKIEDVVNLDDNENISKIMIDGNEVYAIKKGGSISTEDFSISGIHVQAPYINPTQVGMNLPSLPPIAVNLPPVELNLPEIPEQTYDIKLQNVDKALLALNNVKTVNPINVEVELSIPSSLMSGNSVSFQNLDIKLPWGLITDNQNYNKNTGVFHIDNIPVNANGKAVISFTADGIELGDKGILENHNLNINGNVGIESGKIVFNLTNVNIDANFNLDINYKVSSFDVKSFSGDIDYQMGDINIAPIYLSGLPDFLDSPETEIRIADPEINISINNPVGQYGLQGKGIISLTSNFNNGETTFAESEVFNIVGEEANLKFVNSPSSDTNEIGFYNLSNILTNENAGGLPNSITVNLEDIRFYGHAVDFPIGRNFGKANGDYDFTAPLGFDSPSTVVYETTENGWGSEDLKDVNIQLLRLKAKCTTNLPVAVKLNVVPVDDNGNPIAVKEIKSLVINPKSSNEQVEFELEAIDEQHPISAFDGVRFRAIISQDDENNTQAIGPDLNITLSEIRATVDGYYETDF